VLLKLAYFVAYYNLYFGEDSIVFSQPVAYSSLKDLAFLLYGNGSRLLPATFIGLAAFSSLYAMLFKKRTLLPDLITWFCILNLQNKVFPTLTGGDFLLNQFLLMNCFLTYNSSGIEHLVTARRVLHNLICVVLHLQIAFVYFLSALAKLYDNSWLSGTALNTISQIDYFSMASAFRGKSWQFLFTVMTWLVLVYQLAFPVLMWWPRIKKGLLITGVIMHLYIALVMGLFQFGLVMIAAYVFLWPAKTRNRLN
jgi:hypothetical protein